MLHAVFFSSGIAANIALAAGEAPLAANDVSWLFPPPTKPADLDNLIAIRDLTAEDPKNPGQRTPVWPQPAFDRFIELALSDAGKVPGHRINLPDEVRTIDAWHIAAVRIDPIAPGLSPGIQAQFGQIPQIRLVLQPVTRGPDGRPTVHDLAAHLTYNFIGGVAPPADVGCGPVIKPDLSGFRPVVRDAAGLRTRLAEGAFGGVKIATGKAPLGVHPGLKDARTAKAVRDEMKGVIERGLAGRVPGAMAIMGLPSPDPEPWIFLAMKSVGQQYEAVRGPTLDGKQTAQALSFREDPRGVVIPSPKTDNLNPITCHHAELDPPGGPMPLAKRKGVSTAALFGPSPPPTAKVKSMVDLIGDPGKSHFFNTDCISCHTETRRSIVLLKTKTAAGIDPAVLPKEDWNVRNIGWFPSFLHPERGTAPTITRRTANETAEVVKFINANLLGD